MLKTSWIQNSRLVKLFYEFVDFVKISEKFSREIVLTNCELRRFFASHTLFSATRTSHAHVHFSKISNSTRTFAIVRVRFLPKFTHLPEVTWIAIKVGIILLLSKILSHRHTVIMSYCHTVVQSYSCTVVQLYSRTVARSYSRTVVRLYRTTVIPLYGRIFVCLYVGGVHKIKIYTLQVTSKR